MKKIQILGAVLAAVSSLTMGISVPASAQTTNTSVTINPVAGGLTVTSSATLVLNCTPACTISSTNQAAVSGASNIALVATDSRGTGAGWNLTSSMANFVNATSGDVIPLATATSAGTSQFQFARGAISVSAGQPAWVTTAAMADETTLAQTTTVTSLDAAGISNTYSLAQASGQGSIGRVVVTNGGTGYATAPTVSITGASCTGVAATASVTAGVVTAIAITNGGSGCTGIPTVSITDGSGTGATATAVRGAGEGVFDKTLSNINLTIPALTRAGTYTADFETTIV